MTSTNQSQQLLSLGDKPVLGTFLEEKLVPVLGIGYIGPYPQTWQGECWILVQRHYLLHNPRGQHYPFTVAHSLEQIHLLVLK